LPQLWARLGPRLAAGLWLLMVSDCMLIASLIRLGAGLRLSMVSDCMLIASLIRLGAGLWPRLLGA
jgi:hypothetical protein